MEVSVDCLPTFLPQGAALDDSGPVGTAIGFKLSPDEATVLPSLPGSAIGFLWAGLAAVVGAHASLVETFGSTPLFLHFKCRGGAGLDRALAREEICSLATGS